MELNAENVKKALECCANAYDCFTCDSYKRQCIGGFRTAIAQNALALITSQEQKIKELTEENERLKSVEFTCGFIKPHKVLECPIFDEIEKAKSDTVRKMQERLIAEFRKDGRMNYYIRMTLDQIAKEMLEANNERT